MTMRARRGMTTVEIVIATLILSIALVPLYQTFVRSQRTVVKSRLAYMAMHVAREELDELRQTPFAKVQGHGWDRVIGSVFRRTIPPRASGAGNPLLTDPKYAYPAEYARIMTMVTVKPTSDLRLKTVLLEVKWEETGEGSAREHEATNRFETVIANLSPER